MSSNILMYSAIVIGSLLVGDALYFAVIHSSNKSNYIVITPDFTSSAYQPNGFYSYYNHNCDIRCLNVPISVDDANLTVKYSDSFNAKLLFWISGFQEVSDMQVDTNPHILDGKTVILLHNEYVTQNEFNAINSSSKVIFFYPNSMYALVDYNTNHYQPSDPLGLDMNMITLIKGHGYNNTTSIWKYDNTQYEKSGFCTTQKFTRIYDNHYQLDCWAQDPFKILSYIWSLPI